MGNCPICNSFGKDGITTCECGYDFAKMEIADPNRIQAYIASLSKKSRWTDEVRTKGRIHEIQKQRYGATRYGTRGGWSFEKTAHLLDESKGLTKPDIELAQALDEHSELLSARNKSEAKKRLKVLKEGQTTTGETATFDFEAQLQDYLFNRWEETPFHAEWIVQDTDALRQGKYDTQEIGEIDILAKHRKDNRWLVIELKRDHSSDETVGQILRYMGWVKENLAGKDGKVEGIIISNAADHRVRYALACVPNVELKIYSIQNGQLKIEGPQMAYNWAEVSKMSRAEQESFIQVLKKISSAKSK